MKRSIYGFCPLCGGNVTTRERRPDGNDTCENKHTYPSRQTKSPAHLARVIRIDKGDYFLLVHQPEEVRSFCVSWPAEEAKQKHFQQWLDNKQEQYESEIPAGFVLFDEHMNQTTNNLISKTWRFARQDRISIEAKDRQSD